MSSRGGTARLGPVDELDLRPVFQPIVDLRDQSVVGYEALMRVGNGDGELRSAHDLLAAARREDSVAALDLAARDAALRVADDHGLGPPFSLFLNVDPETLDAGLPELPANHRTHLIEVTEEALIARPEAMLRALTELRSAGWGIALDDVGADSRSLALMPVLYPDVIKLDLRLLADRDPRDVARVVTAVAAEAERRHATVLAEGIDAEKQLALARAYGATLGQGYLLGGPDSLPDPLRPPAVRCGSPARAATRSAPAVGAGHELAAADARAVGPRRAGRQRDPSSARPTSARPRWCLSRSPTSGTARTRSSSSAGSATTSPSSGSSTWAARPSGPASAAARSHRTIPLRGTGTLVALAPGFSACFVVRDTGDGRTWEFATTYDRDTVVECALPLMARMEPLGG